MYFLDWRENARQRLQGEEAESDLIYLAEALAGISRVQQKISNPALSEKALFQLEEALARRIAGEPLAYIVGHQPFYDLDLYVNSHTLIPRPASEHLVEEALVRLFPHKFYQVADLGTGSGALAIAIAKQRPQLRMLAVDKSFPALLIARENARRHKIENIAFLCAHWTDALANNCLDCIVSNPPYIAPDDAHLKALRYEPQSALVAENDGYADLFFLLENAPRVLKNGGWLLLEHGFTQAKRLRAFAEAQGIWQKIEHARDYGGHVRVSAFQRGAR